MLWAGWLVETGALFSFAQGIIHPYYTVALAPALGALIGIGVVTLWRRRTSGVARTTLGLAIGITAVWAFVLLDRTPTWLPALRWAVLVVGLMAAAGVTAEIGRSRRIALAIGLGGLATGLLAPTAVAIDTAATPHSGAIPSAGPPGSTAGFGPGGGPAGGGGPGPAGGFPGARRGGPAGSVRSPGRLPGSGLGGTLGAVRLGPSSGQATGGRGSPAGGAPGAGSIGGLLNSTTPGTSLVKRLERGAARYSWVAATVGSNAAAGYQLATGDPVMAIGGFNGTDPAPTLAEFEDDVRAGKIHYFMGHGTDGRSAAGLGAGSPGATPTTGTRF